VLHGTVILKALCLQPSFYLNPALRRPSIGHSPPMAAPQRVHLMGPGACWCPGRRHQHGCPTSRDPNTGWTPHFECILFGGLFGG